MAFRPPTPGALIENKYRLAERIGGGGMGDVYRAENVLAGRPVAIKFLHPELAQNMEVAQRFFQEAQAVNKIRHPNVVDVLDAGVGEMGPYIVMEYLEGESVGSALTRTGRFEVDAAVGTVMPVLEALDAAHRVGIIHRDLKPENVFIAYDTARNMVVVRLLDFGIAKVLDAGAPGPRTRTGVVFGTPDYLSPEQATGEGPLDGRSDLFAVGVLLYELMTGARPFRAPTAVATAFKVVHAEAPSIASSGVHVEPRVEGIVQRLLQKEPARRFPTAGDVIRELEKVSPDPMRRMMALAKIIGVHTRISQTPATDGTLQRDADLRAASRPAPHPAGSSDSERAALATRRLVTDISQVATQPFSGLGSQPAPNPRPAAEPSTRAGTWSTDAAQLRIEPPKSARPPLADLPKTLRSQVVPPADAPPPRSVPGVRPLPVRFAGRYQVRGPVLRSVDKVVLELFGAEARDEIVASMPDAWAADFRNDSINALVAYDLDALDSYLEHATALAVHDPGRWREIGRLAVDGELQNVVRTLLRPAVDVAQVIRRGISTWARLFSFGVWKSGATPAGRVSLSVSDFEPVAQPLRLWVVGVVEQTCRRAVRPDLRVVVTSGEQDFSPEIVCEIV